MSLNKVLLIEDAPEYQKIVTATLGERFDVVCAATAEDALARLAHESFEILLIDVGLPGQDGLSLCEELRKDPKYSNLPILMITGRSDVSDIVLGLEAGADDYIQKPFRAEELRARVDARLRRAQVMSEGIAREAAIGGPDKFEHGRLQFAIGLQRVSQITDGGLRALELTPNEFKILYFLARSEGQTRSRDEILKEVWGEHLHVIERTVDKHISALRRKMGDAGAYVASVPGKGYRFDAKALENPVVHMGR